MGVFLLGQWLNLNFFGIPYLVGKIKFKLHWLSEFLCAFVLLCVFFWLSARKKNHDDFFLDLLFGGRVCFTAFLMGGGRSVAYLSSTLWFVSTKRHTK